MKRVVIMRGLKAESEIRGGCADDSSYSVSHVWSLVSQALHEHRRSNSTGRRPWHPSSQRKAALPLAVSLAVLLAGSSVVFAATAQMPQRVPTVGCPANDQMGRASLQTAELMPTPVEPAIAEQLAYYQAEESPGVFAPKGWSCRAWYGSSGSVLLVTPRRLEPPFFPLPRVSGPAVMIETADGSSAGRIHVAIVAAQLFPLVGGDFIAGVRQEHLVSDATFDVEPHPNDELRYLSDRLVEYTTPANHAGLGTDGQLEVSALPIRGLSILNVQAETDSLTEVRVRLPGALNAVAEAIVQLETACVQQRRGCRSLH